MRARVHASAEAASPRLTGAVMGAGSPGHYYPVLAYPPIRHPRGAGMVILLPSLSYPSSLSPMKGKPFQDECIMGDTSIRPYSKQTEKSVPGI